MAVVAIDWDNTLVFVTEWLPGAKDAIKLLREKGHKVIIHSANNPEWIKKNLAEAGLPVDGVWDKAGKPVADIYIDDKGYRFTHNGDWADHISEVLGLLEGLDNRKWAK